MKNFITGAFSLLKASLCINCKLYHNSSKFRFFPLTWKKAEVAWSNIYDIDYVLLRLYVPVIFPWSLPPGVHAQLVHCNIKDPWISPHGPCGQKKQADTCA